MAIDVKIAGLSPDQVLDVSATDRSGAELGTATIQCVDTASNRNFQPGDDIDIDFGPGVTWEGSVTGQPSASNGRLTFTGHGDLLTFKHGRLYRVFYNIESSEAVRDMVTEQTEQLPEFLIHTGDSPGDWSSEAPVAEPYQGDRAGLYDFGTDMLFLGCREGFAGELRTTYSNVTSDAIEDGFFELKSRMITRDLAGIWSIIIELKTPGGTSYRWEPELRQGPHTYTLAVEDAVPKDSGLSSGELRYRFISSGVVAEPFGVFLDHAATIPFRTSSRPNALSIDRIDPSGRTITRRFDSSVGRAVEELAVEDDAAFADKSNGFQYIPGGEIQSTAGLTIDRNGSTPITNVDVDRDFESIRNEVVVQGADGVEVVVREQGSIDFYGPLPRPEPITDPELQTEDEARERGNGFLEDRAYNDADVTYSIADLSYAQLNGEEYVEVKDSDEGLDGEYKIGNIEVTSDGIVNVTVTASTFRT